MRKLLRNKALVSKVLFVALIIFVFTFSVALAEFSRQTGEDVGWGYGYGYGYGIGYGWDGGTEAGRRIGGEEDLSSYGYGYGYGYVPENSSYDEDAGAYLVDVDDMSSLILTGVMRIEGESQAETTAVTFNDNVQIADGDIQIYIPSGTIMTSSEDGGTFDPADLTSGDVIDAIVATTIASNADVQGGVEFGIPGASVHFSQPIRVVIPIADTALEGTDLSLSRSPDDGETWTTDGLTAAITDTCGLNEADVWVGSDPVTEATVTDGVITIYTCSASYFATYNETATIVSSGGGGVIITAQACTAVTYGDWAACTDSYKFRQIISRTPANCALTSEQQVAATEYCGTTPLPGATLGADAVKAVMANERSLVKKVNSGLVKRLLGRILLQVEEKGQAWYLEPVSQKKFFMGRAADAYTMMRRFGLGISETNFSKFEKSGVPSRFAGRIFLRVQKNGEAYYVNPVNMKMYYLGRAEDALKIMRELALGITNANIRQIAVGE